MKKKIKLNEDFLPDFISLTNYCESLGYVVDFRKEVKGFVCDVYLNKKPIHVGSKYFSNTMEAQKESYSQIYKKIKK
tara:strand:- start:1329 stop:1559 length:231 start_codon:yes stop_codon:yes gene_type:complete